MSMMPPPHAPVNDTLADLEKQLRKELYAPGAPEHVTEATARHDAQAVAKMRCPGCHRRRMEYHPYHRRSSYRVLAGCTECGAAEEV